MTNKLVREKTIERWAILCGQIRNDYEFKAIVDRVLLAQSEGDIQGIVVSTWRGEFKDKKDYRNHLLNIGVHISEIPPISSADVPYTNIGYYRQAKLLDAGLQFIPKDSMIIKCRTDFSQSYFNELISNLNDSSLEIKSENVFNMSFLKKIQVMELGMSPPFSLMDMVYYGTYYDLKKLINFTNSPDNVFSKIAPDFAFFVAPFINIFPLVNDFFTYINTWSFKKIISILGEISIDIETIPPIFYKIYAMYLLILDSCFYHPPSVKDNAEVTINVEDIFFKTKNKNVQTRWGKSFKDSTIVHKIICARVDNSDFSNRLQNWIKYINNSTNAKSVHITYEDLSDLDLWAKSNLKINTVLNSNAKYLASEIHYTHNLQSSYSSSPTIDNDLLCSTNFYGYIENNYSKNICKIPNNELVTLAMRKINSTYLSRVAYLLYSDNICDNLHNAANYPFNRYRKELLSAPYSWSRFCTNYYYSKYIFNRDPSYMFDFMTSICRYYGCIGGYRNIDNLIVDMFNRLINSSINLDKDIVKSLLILIPKDELNSIHFQFNTHILEESKNCKSQICSDFFEEKLNTVNDDNNDSLIRVQFTDKMYASFLLSINAQEDLELFLSSISPSNDENLIILSEIYSDDRYIKKDYVKSRQYYERLSIIQEPSILNKYLTTLIHIDTADSISICAYYADNYEYCVDDKIFYDLATIYHHGRTVKTEILRV